MIGLPTGAPLSTDPETVVIVARVVLASFAVVAAVCYRAWSTIIESSPVELKRRIGALIEQME